MTVKEFIADLNEALKLNKQEDMLLRFESQDGYAIELDLPQTHACYFKDDKQESLNYVMRVDLE